MNLKFLGCLFSLLFVLACNEKKPSFNDVVSASNKEDKQENIANSDDELNITAKDSSSIIEDSIQLVEEPSAKEVVIEDVDEKIDKEEPKPAKKKVLGKGKIAFETYVYEFGEIDEGDIIKYDFYFTNKGQRPINIKNCTATCGCTVPSYPFLPIGPGEKGYIGVTYNSLGKFGKQTPVVTVISDADEKVVKLKLTGTVIPKLQNEGDQKEKLDSLGSSN